MGRRGQSNRGIIFILVIFIGIVIGIGVFLLDYIGMINFKESAMNQVMRIPYIKEKIHKPGTAEPSVQQQEWNKIKKAISIQKETLDKEKQAIEKLKKELETKNDKLIDKEKKLTEREKNLEEKLTKYNTREARLTKQVKYYSIMKPENSANLLPRLPQSMTIEILKRMDDELAVQILSLMDSEVSAELLRKMNKNN